jgi:mannose-6-phosphate isomerase
LKKIAFLENKIQEYAWGSRSFISRLLGESVPSPNPQAELWMGTHPQAVSSVLIDDEVISLAEWIQNDPDSILGHDIARTFSNELPFLFKILAAQKPLSIQAHPNRKQAKEGFQRENQLNIPLEAPTRNYKDNNHKPELICALEPFTILKGFRKASEIRLLVEKGEMPAQELGVEFLTSLPPKEGLKNFFSHLLSMPKDLQNQVVNQITEKIHQKAVAPSSVFEWILRLNEAYPGDIGVISPIFLNLFQLQPQEALFIPAGELHVYLEGVGLEIMANSDNVLRGGLTPKHIDIPELCRVLDFQESPIHIQKPEFNTKGEGVYYVPAKEFMLSVIEAKRGESYFSPETRSVEIMICLQGEASIMDLNSMESLSLSRGKSVIIPAGIGQYQIDGEAVIYKASVPL